MAYVVILAICTFQWKRSHLRHMIFYVKSILTNYQVYLHKECTACAIDLWQ